MLTTSSILPSLSGYPSTQVSPPTELLPSKRCGRDSTDPLFDPLSLLLSLRLFDGFHATKVVPYSLILQADAETNEILKQAPSWMQWSREGRPNPLPANSPPWLEWESKTFLVRSLFFFRARGYCDKADLTFILLRYADLCCSQGQLESRSRVEVERVADLSLSVLPFPLRP